MGIVFLHGGIVVKLCHLTHPRGIVPGENHDSAMPDWQWRRLRCCFFVESIALETIRGSCAIGADLVFAVAQGMSPMAFVHPRGASKTAPSSRLVKSCLCLPTLGVQEQIVRWLE
jgi:hypothetical protein